MAEAEHANLSHVLAGALISLKAHPAVMEVKVVETCAQNELIAVAIFEVNLPSRWAAAGQSENGVYLHEEVLVHFPPDFPRGAPTFTLRPDFPTALPHIHAHKSGERVPPCIAFGDSRDVLHSDGMYRLVDQMSDWLDKAAVDALTSEEKGWEPTRRDAGFNLLQMDTDSLAQGRLPFGGWKMFVCWGHWDAQAKFSFATAPKPSYAPWNMAWLNQVLATHKTAGDTRAGDAPVVFCWPQVAEGGKPSVNNRYKADTVSTFAELAAQATEWGCRVALDNFLNNLNPVFASSQYAANMPIYFVFPVRRPIHLIGSESEYEMIAYRVQISVPGQLLPTSDIPVAPIALTTPIVPDLLRRTSGLEAPPLKLNWTFLGCGSLGSKLVMHLARAGVRPGLLIDSKRIVAHNAARHALLPLDVNRLRSKAKALAEIVTSFSLDEPQTFLTDIWEFPFDAGRYRGKFYEEHSLVVNTTGSPAVRDYLTKLPFGARVAEGALVNHGAGAFFTVEGMERNPSSVDLLHHCYERMRETGLLTDAPRTEDSVLEIGVGCHSVTMPMSDARVSLVASGIGQKLLEFDQSGVPDQGIAATAAVSDDGMSIGWNVESVGQTHEAQVFDEGGWTVSVLDSAHRKIVDDVSRYPGVESGGLIVGSISALTREVFVTGVLPAPADSARSAARFILGTQGRAQMIDAYQETAHGTLWCLGTWHSHLMPSGPSQMDRDTAALLDGQLRHAAVLLIRHPEGYAALVREGAVS